MSIRRQDWMHNKLYQILRIQTKSDLGRIASKLSIPTTSLAYWNANHILPSGNDLKAICRHLNISELQLKLALGVITQDVLDAISDNFMKVSDILAYPSATTKTNGVGHQLVFESKLGRLNQGDCLSLLKALPDKHVDVVFADPPFNLNKLYPSQVDDDLKHHKYIEWCEDWIYECVRILKEGGSFFLWNLPKWNTYFSGYINKLLTFRHWIAVDIKYSLPIQGRLYPSHYALLYYCKGQKPFVFKPDRLPMQICPHCYMDLVDYGGYKDKMNPLGVNLSDVWRDVPPVRHAKYKKREGANELSIKLLDRIIELSSNEGDVIFDPFGGSGTTYAVAELKNRKWIGIELGPCDGIIERLNDVASEASSLSRYRMKLNKLINSIATAERIKLGIWTPETIRKKPTK